MNDTVDCVLCNLYRELETPLSALYQAKMRSFHFRPYSPATALCCCDFFTKFWQALKCEDGTSVLLPSEHELGLLILAQCIATLANVLDRNQLLNIVDIKTLLTITE